MTSHLASTTSRLGSFLCRDWYFCRWCVIHACCCKSQRDSGHRRWERWRWTDAKNQFNNLVPPIVSLVPLCFLLQVGYWIDLEMMSAVDNTLEHLGWHSQGSSKVDIIWIPIGILSLQRSPIFKCISQTYICGCHLVLDANSRMHW